MSVRAKHRAALATLGIEVTEYYIEGWPPVWGTSLVRNEKELAVIETHGCHTDDDRLRNRYMLKTRRGVLARPVTVHRTKREALAEFARRFA